MFSKHYAGLDITSSEDNGSLLPVSRVTLVVSDDLVLTAGDDTGLEITADCPHATQAMVDAIYNRLKGFKYRMLSANDANIDPAAELGDGFTADGVYSVMARISDDGSGYMSVSAPGESELEEEFPIDGPLTQVFNRKIAETRSSITKTAEEIRLEIVNEGKRLSSEITQKIDSIKLNVSGGLGGTASIELSVNGTKQTGSVELENVREAFANDESQITINAGLVTFDSNTFVVNSDNFGVTKSGVVTAKNANISGTITATSGSFDSVTISGSTFSGQLSGATGSISGVTGSYSGSIYSGGTFTGTGSGMHLTNSSYGWLNGSSSGIYNGYVQSCSTDGTTFEIASGSLSSSGSSPQMYGRLGGKIASNNAVFTQGTAGALESGNLTVTGDISCQGTKSRAIKTEHFGTRCLDALETALPTFSDYGMAKLDETGVCWISIDPVFAETINQSCVPTVFLTKYGEGDIWVYTVDANFITVKGTPGISFSWQIMSQQANCFRERMRILDIDIPTSNADQGFSVEADIDAEKTSVDYEKLAYDYYTDFERRLSE